MEERARVERVRDDPQLQPAPAERLEQRVRRPAEDTRRLPRRVLGLEIAVELLVGGVDPEVAEQLAHEPRVLDLLECARLPEHRLVPLAEVRGDLRRLGQAVPPERCEPCAMAGLDELRLVRERHQRVAPVEENRAQHRGYASDVARKVLWASFALVPLTFLADYVLHWGDVALFVLAALALVPLAWLIGEATEHAAHHTGPGHRRLPERDVRQRARADHLDARDQPRAHRGRPRIADRKRRRERAARARLLALLRPRRPAVDRESSFIWLGLILVADARVPHPCDPGLARRPGAPLARGALAPGLDRAARPVRRRHVVAAEAPRATARGAGELRRRVVARDRDRRPRRRDGR